MGELALGVVSATPILQVVVAKPPPSGHRGWLEPPLLPKYGGWPPEIFCF
jgi:hypothetical protein